MAFAADDVVGGLRMVLAAQAMSMLSHGAIGEDDELDLGVGNRRTANGLVRRPANSSTMRSSLSVPFSG